MFEFLITSSAIVLLCAIGFVVLQESVSRYGGLQQVGLSDNNAVVLRYEYLRSRHPP